MASQVKGENTSQECSLEPMNLHDGFEFGELRRQRIACGWNHEREVIECWRNDMDAKMKTLFWITIRASTSDKEPSPNRAGHISLTYQKDPPDLEMANPDKSAIEISNLFILPEYRKLGLATQALAMVEELAKSEPYGGPNCKALTLNTASKRYWDDDGDEWRGLWLKAGLNVPERGWSLEHWYETMGFVKFKEAPTYETSALDGTELKWWASFMKKMID